MCNKCLGVLFEALKRINLECTILLTLFSPQLSNFLSIFPYYGLAGWLISERIIVFGSICLVQFSIQVEEIEMERFFRCWIYTICAAIDIWHIYTGAPL